MKNALHGERGAVNILFLIVVLVIAIAFVVLWFTQLQENEKLLADAQRATAESKVLEDRINYQREWYGRFAAKIGSTVPATMEISDEDIANRKPIAEITQRIEEGLNVQLGLVDDMARSPGARPETLHAAWDIFVAKIRQLEADITQRDGRITALEAQVSQLNETIATNTATHNDARAKLQEEKDADSSRLNAQIDRLRTENEQLQANVQTAQATTETTRNDSQKAVLAERNRTNELDRAVAGVKQQRTLEFRTEAPDGRVVAVDRRRGIAFVDFGSRQQLHAGLRFRVQEDTKNGLVHKGYLRIVSVQPDMAEARIEDEAADAGGIGVSDIVSNPVFRRDGSKVRFSFLGQLPGRFNREVAEQILREQGALVEEKVAVTTDFLVLGQNESEEDVPLTENENYLNARRWGIQIITEKDLAPFLRR